jgi:hypothetical protein
MITEQYALLLHISGRVLCNRVVLLQQCSSSSITATAVYYNVTGSGGNHTKLKLCLAMTDEMVIGPSVLAKITRVNIRTEANVYHVLSL